MDKGHFAVDVAIGVEEVIEALFDARNVPDILEEAYPLAFSNDAREGVSLVDNYQEELSEGVRQVTGFVSNLKAKVVELHTEDLLEEQNPGWDFSLAESATQEGWDLIGSGPDGQEILVQVKTGSEEYLDDVLEAIEADPEYLFAVSSEIYDAIAESHPELVRRLIADIGSNEELTENVEEGLADLAGNLGIDVPDALGGTLPIVGETVLGIRIIWQLVETEKELQGVAIDDRARVHAIRALTLLTRFGVNRVLALAGMSGGAGGGTAVAPGVGTAIGGAAGLAGGLVSGIVLNQKLKPQIERLAMILVRGDSDRVFYLMNKATIDDLASSFAGTSAA